MDIDKYRYIIGKKLREHYKNLTIISIELVDERFKLLGEGYHLLVSIEYTDSNNGFTIRIDKHIEINDVKKWYRENKIDRLLDE